MQIIPAHYSRPTDTIALNGFYTAHMAPETTPQHCDRLADQLTFLMAIDALKRVQRANRITAEDPAGGRRENSAEHSWHVALFARILSEHANQPVDVDRVVTMLLVHDVVEIDVGDTPLHATQDPDKSKKEAAAANRLFALLPADQGTALERLWNEFESGDTADALFARALDRIQPILLNAHTEGGTWPPFGVTRKQMVARTGHVADGSAALWAQCETLIDEAVRKGWIQQDAP